MEVEVMEVEVVEVEVQVGKVEVVEIGIVEVEVVKVVPVTVILAPTDRNQGSPSRKSFAMVEVTRNVCKLSPANGGDYRRSW